MYLSRSTAPLRSLLFLSRRLSSQPSPPLTQESLLYTLKKLHKDDKSPLKALSFFHSSKTQHAGFAPGSSAYNLMLRILCRRECLPQFWTLVQDMESAGLSMDHGTYQSLLGVFKREKLTEEAVNLGLCYGKLRKDATTEESVKSVADAVLLYEDFGTELGKVTNFVLSEEMVVLVLRELRQNPQKALAFFNWAKHKEPGYEHGSVSYNAMARVLGRDESMENFWDLVNEMKHKGFDVDIDTYVKTLRHFRKRGLIADAVELYEIMMDGPYKPAAQDCPVLLREISSASQPDMDLVYRVVGKYEAHGHKITKPIYDGIHRTLTSGGRFEEAEEVVKKMKNDGYEPDNITYSQVVYGMCKANRLDDARQVLEEMSENGCPPDLKTWTVLLNGQCKWGEFDRAVEGLADMIERNILPDSDLLDILVKAMCRSGKANGAYALFVEMVEKTGVKPFQASYKLLINELLRAKMIKEAHGLCKSMKNQKIPPFWEPFGMHIAKHGTLEDAKELLKELSKNKNPPAKLYLALFRCFFEEGRYAEAQDLLYRCPRHIRQHGEIVKLFGTRMAESVSQGS